MVDILKKIKKRLRMIVQFVFTALTNGYVQGFVDGKIFRGKTKSVCVPGLNCYSCPGAVGSCPVGALQSSLSSREHKFSFYISGFLILVGALFGRFVCGWLCPFGLVQDLLYKIPFFKKLKKLPGDKFLKFLKYFILVVFVILLPLFAVDAFGMGETWFCKYICPSGTLGAGVPLAVLNEGIRNAIGWLYTWKVAILVVIVFFSVLVYRPFCRYLCPLGAFYGLFNKISLYRYRIDESKCTSCGACQKACKIDIKTFKDPNSMECIRCGDCIKSCPHNAIKKNFINKESEKK